MEHRADALRTIAARLILPPVRHITREPGVQAVYRVTIDYFDPSIPDSVATLIQRSNPAEMVLNIVYEGALSQKPLVHHLQTDRFQALTIALQTLHFDTLSDQPNIPFYSTDIWLIERAAGSFVKSLITAPSLAQPPHRDLVEAIRTHLPEAVRQIR